MGTVHGQIARWLSLSIATLGMLLVWLVVLPWLERHSAMQSRIEYLDHQGIDPGALYYSDLEGMPRWERQVQAAQARKPDAFWRVGAPRTD